MTTWTRSLSLMLALAVLAAGTVTLAAAQDPAKKAAPQKDDKKKDDKKADDKKDEKKADDKVGTIEIFKGKLGYRWRMRNAEGTVIAMPLPQAAWETKEEAIKALDELKATLNKAKPTEVKD